MQFPVDDKNNKLKKWIEEEPLCEAFDMLPEPLTKTVSTSNIH